MPKTPRTITEGLKARYLAACENCIPLSQGDVVSSVIEFMESVVLVMDPAGAPAPTAPAPTA